MTSLIRFCSVPLTAVALLLAPLGGVGLSAQGASGDPVLVLGSRNDVLLLGGASRDPEADDRRVARLISGCQQVMIVSPADSAAVTNLRVRPWTQSTAAASNVLTVVVLPPGGRFINCGEWGTQLTLASARGLRIVSDTLLSPRREVWRAIAHRGSEVLPLIETQFDIITRLTPAGLRTSGDRMLRLALDIDWFAPDESGVRNDLWLEVWNAADAVPVRVPLPWSAVRRVWDAFYESRSALAAGATAERGVRVALPVPDDSVLRAAHRAYTAGELGLAVRLAHSRLSASGLTLDDERNARMHLGLSMANLGDSAAARVVLGTVLEREPCLTLDGSAPAYARDLVSRLQRPPARCTAKSILYTAVRGTVLPGFGRPTTKNRTVSNAVLLGAMAMGFAVAQSNARLAREDYREYLAVQAAPDTLIQRSAASIYARAESHRMQGRTVLALVGAVWGATVAEAVVKESLHARALARVRKFGGPSGKTTVGLVPLGPVPRFVLSVSLAW